MSNEEILDKYIELINKGYCDDCNNLNCIDNFPHKKIAKAIEELQKENQQLKEKNKLEFNDFIKFKKEQEDRHLEKTNKLIKEKYQLKKQLKQRDEVIDATIDDINLVIELVKQQPTENDTWILERINGFKYILNKYKNN